MTPDISRCQGSMHIQFVEGGLDLSREYPRQQAGCGLVSVHVVKVGWGDEMNILPPLRIRYIVEKCF